LWRKIWFFWRSREGDYHTINFLFLDWQSGSCGSVPE
jgi:hypothetical protein